MTCETRSIGESCGLRWGQQFRVLREEVLEDIPGLLRDMLNHHLVTYCGTDPDGLVFTASNGSPLRNSNFTKNVWQPTLEAAELPATLRIHDLRHTAAALLISKGATRKRSSATSGTPRSW